jgi:renalase
MQKRNWNVLNKNSRLAIVGAGMAGAACAHTLRHSGFEGKIKLFEKARGAGGRMSTRRMVDENATAIFDFGAQFFTVRSANFSKFVESQIEKQLVKPWSNGFPNELGSLPPEKHVRYFAPRGMNSLPKELLAQSNHLETQFGSRAIKVIPSKENKVSVHLENGDEEVFDALVLTCPAQQTLELLKTYPTNENAMQTLHDIRYSSCFAIMLHLSENFAWSGTSGKHLTLNGGMHFTSSEYFSFASAPKIKGISQYNSLMVHTSGEFSEGKSAEDKENVFREIETEIEKLFGVKNSDCKARDIHFWRYSQPVNECSKEGLSLYADSSKKLIVAGDAQAGGRVEGAFESGRHAALQLLSLG